jgi:pimeloyl-ACP methyl ester carboxylesterase
MNAPALPPGVKTRRVGDHDMAYLERGQGAPLLLVHGSLADYRYWSPQMAPLSQGRRVVAVSMRRYYPERWDGEGAFSWRLHVEDLARFIEAEGAGPVDLVGHSRGGYLATHLALARPDLVRRLVLAEPGLPPIGILGPSPEAQERAAALAARWRRTAEMVLIGEREAAAEFVLDGIAGPGTWAASPEPTRQTIRDNLMTAVGEARDTRAPVTPEDARRIKSPTLLIGGALSHARFSPLLSALEAAIPDVRRVTIERAAHAMNRMNAAAFNAALAAFLSG